MADKSKEKKSKEEKKKEKAEKKALKKEAKLAKKKARLDAKKKNTKESVSKESNNDKKPSKKSFLTIKKLIFFSLFILVLMGGGFFIYKTYFKAPEEPIVYKSVVLKNVNLPDEMLQFSFEHINDLYFALVTYNLRIFLITNEIDRITKIGNKYPEQAKIAEKEKKNWTKVKENVIKKFDKIEKQIRELYVLYNVNKEQGKKKIKEKTKELIDQANGALISLDPFIEKIKVNKAPPPQGFINNTIFKIKNIFQ